MTLKYESELLFDLMKRDGDDTPSDVLPYESELKEKYLNQVVGAYPKLQDYQPEWLNYNLYHHLPSEFPVKSVSNVTSASFNHVVPYAYESAILKGQTLVNIVNNDNWVQETGSPTLFTQNISIKKGQSYTVIGKIEKSDTFVGTADPSAFRIRTGTNNSGESLVFIQQNDGVFKQTFTNNNNDTIHIRFFNQKTNYKKLMIIEGDYTNVDIPYFEGMQSVQMPVLTTIGKNLLDVESVFKVDGNTVKEAKDGSVVLYKPSYNSYIFETIKVKANTTYTISCEIEKIIDGGKPVYGLGGVTENKTAISDSNGNLVLFMRAGEQTKKSEVKFYNIQLEQGSQSTSYEPHKSNILTVNEEVVLRSLPNGVEDTLNLITGEYVQRICEVVLNGTEPWDKESNRYWVRLGKHIVGNTGKYDDNLLTNKYAFFPVGALNSADLTIGQCRWGANRNFVVNHDDGAMGVASWKEYLSQNPLTIQCQLATPIIKTVDLTVTDHDGKTESTIRPIEGTMHVHTSSQTLSPLLDMGVPVEATTQNLMSFANIEGEE